MLLGLPSFAKMQCSNGNGFRKWA